SVVSSSKGSNIQSKSSSGQISSIQSNIISSGTPSGIPRSLVSSGPFSFPTSQPIVTSGPQTSRIPSTSVPSGPNSSPSSVRKSFASTTRMSSIPSNI